MALTLSKKAARRESKENAKSLEYSLHRAAEIALCYGFTPTEAPTISKADATLARALVPRPQVPDDNHTVTPHLDEKIALMRHYLDKGMQAFPQPVMIYYEGLPKREGERRDNRDTRIELEIIGTSMSVADAILIQAALSILEEEGFVNLVVDINTLGDRDSFTRFTRELINYYRAHVAKMSVLCKQLFKRDPIELFFSTEEPCKDLVENAPKPISFLSEPSRNHFKELLEYLETSEINYKINHTLLSGKYYCSHTTFEIKGCRAGAETEELTLAAGLRYNGISKKVGFKKEVGAVGVTINLKDGKAKPGKKAACWKFKKPLVYLVQMGPEAKQKSLKIIETLRKAKIAIYHSLTKDKLVNQLSHAEALKVPYLVIMGQRESMDNTVIVRAAEDRSQDVVRIERLQEYLKGVL